MSKLEKILHDNLPLLFLLIIALIYRLYKINELFPFDYDQEVSAQAAYDFFVFHKLTLIGQELSFQGFFLGPIHNWIQLIPYGINNLTPDWVPVFFLVISLLALVIFYLISQIIFGKKLAVIATAIFTISFAQISFESLVNSNYFIFLSSTGLLFCLYKYFLGKNKFLILGALIAGIATVNFNPIFIFSTIAFFITALLRKKKSLYIFSIAAVAFFANYAPLILFNFRHNNILLTSLKNFILESTTTSGYLDKITFLLKKVITPFYNNFLFQSFNYIFIAFTIALLIYGLYLLLIDKNISLSFLRKRRFIFFIPLWIIIPFVGLIFYQGHIPDYYFQQTLIPFVILITFSLRKNLIIFLIFCIIFVSANIIRVANYQTNINYVIKKKVVNFILTDSIGKNFNVYYDMELGMNTGYSYLFKVFGKEPQEGGENLYILEFVDPKRYQDYKYQIIYSSKTFNIKTIGFVLINSVK